MIAMTTSNSIRVKPSRIRLLMINPLLIREKQPITEPIDEIAPQPRILSRWPEL